MDKDMTSEPKIKRGYIPPALVAETQRIQKEDYERENETLTIVSAPPEMIEAGQRAMREAYRKQVAEEEREHAELVRVYDRDMPSLWPAVAGVVVLILIVIFHRNDI